MLKSITPTLILIMLSLPAKASGPPSTEAMLLLWLVYFLPYIAGLAIAGKGKRLWFTVVSLIIYSISFGSLLFVGLMSDFGIASFFLPYALILVIIIMRLRQRQSN